MQRVLFTMPRRHKTTQKIRHKAHDNRHTQLEIKAPISLTRCDACNISRDPNRMRVLYLESKDRIINVCVSCVQRLARDVKVASESKAYITMSKTLTIVSVGVLLGWMIFLVWFIFGIAKP